MGTEFFHGQAPSKFSTGSLTTTSRALSAPSFASRASGAKSAAALGIAQKAYTGKPLKLNLKDAATAAPGPKV